MLFDDRRGAEARHPTRPEGSLPVGACAHDELPACRPEHLIDLNGVAGLSYICADDGELRIGAMTRHREVETSAVIRERWPLISGCMPYVAHVQIRNRGTLGGSLSHADPAAELPAVMTALEAQFVIRSDSATRTVRAEDFFVGLMTTAMQPGELLIEVRIPPLPQGTGWAFDELSRRRGDFAIVGAAALVHCPGRRRIAWARLTFTGSATGYVPQPSGF
jgi:carbon-monoxide dehydrogenase medium subunit/6-hydroxypseudooxynicotine dehydrogenase subunit alpha